MTQQKTTTSVTPAAGQRVGISFSTDVAQTTVFLTQLEFMELMGKMFDYRDAHKDELQEIVRRMQQ